MEDKKNSKLNIVKKLLTFIPRILYNILIILCVILIAIIVMQRITDSNRTIGGYRIFKVVSGSMVPKYDIGEVVICKEVDSGEIQIGDAIVYRGRIGELNNKLVMHEVVDIYYTQNNERTYYAKGINNNQEDPEVHQEQVLGKVMFKSRILSLMYALATSIYSSFIIITALTLNVFLAFKPERPVRTKKRVMELSEHNDNSDYEEITVINLQNDSDIYEDEEQYEEDYEEDHDEEQDEIELEDNIEQENDDSEENYLKEEVKNNIVEEKRVVKEKIDKKLNENIEKQNTSSKKESNKKTAKKNTSGQEKKETPNKTSNEVPKTRRKSSKTGEIKKEKNEENQTVKKETKKKQLKKNAEK